MAYEKTTWQTGDTITAEKLNNIEQGIVAASGLVTATVDDTTVTLDKTGNDIETMVAAGALPYFVVSGEGLFLLLNYGATADGYDAFFGNLTEGPLNFSAADADTPLSMTIDG